MGKIWKQYKPPSYGTGLPEQGGRGGQRGRQPKFSLDVLFFADEPFKCALFEKSNEKCT